MKKLLIGLMLMVAWVVHGAGALGTLQYRTNDYTLSPSNTMASNIYAGYGLTKLQGPGGAITLSNIWTTNTLASTNWVLEQIASLGTHIFASGVTNTSTLWDGAAFRTNQWYGSNGAVLTITTNIVGVAAVDQYIRHIVSAQTFNRIGDGPIDVRAYIAKTAGAGTTQIHPEVYILFGTNLVELGSSVAQTISGATPVAYNWTITVGATNLASPCSVVWAWKVDSVGTASPQLEFVSGGIYDACLTLVENIASAQLDGSQIVSGTVDNSRLPGNVLTNERSILTTLTTQTNTGTLGIGGAATFNGGVTVTNAAAANGVQMTVGSTAYGVGSVVFSNSAGAMRMGIGTASPTFPLHVVGTIYGSGGISSGGIIEFAGDGRTRSVNFGYLTNYPSIYATHGSPATNLVWLNSIGTRDTNGCGIVLNQMPFGADWYNSNTNTPLWSDGLTLYLPDQLNVLGITNNGSPTVPPLTVGTNGGVAVQVDAAGKFTANGGIIASNAQGLPPLQVFKTNSATPALIVQTNGNVGIGKLPSGYQLDISGDVFATSKFYSSYGFEGVTASAHFLGASNNTLAFKYTGDANAGAYGSIKYTGFRKVMQDTVATNILGLTVTTNNAASVWDDYTIQASDGTNVQVTSGTLTMDVMNVNGVLLFTNIDSAALQRTLVTAGSLAPTWAVVSNAANKVMLTLAADTSLDGAITNLTSTHCIRQNGGAILTLGY